MSDMICPGIGKLEDMTELAQTSDGSFVSGEEGSPGDPDSPGQKGRVYRIQG